MSANRFSTRKASRSQGSNPESSFVLEAHNETNPPALFRSSRCSSSHSASRSRRFKPSRNVPMKTKQLKAASRLRRTLRMWPKKHCRYPRLPRAELGITHTRMSGLAALRYIESRQAILIGRDTLESLLDLLEGRTETLHNGHQTRCGTCGQVTGSITSTV